MADAPGRPLVGWGHYLRDMVYGANDGVITTFAIVSGVEGAAFPAVVAIVLGLANLVADGISMGASNYLGLKSELQQTGGSVSAEQPWRHGLATLAAFVLAGAMPLLAFLAPPSVPTFPLATLLACATLALVGGLRAPLTGQRWLVAAGEMLLIGGLAAAAAYGVGALLHALIL